MNRAKRMIIVFIVVIIGLLIAFHGSDLINALVGMFKDGTNK